MFQLDKARQASNFVHALHFFESMPVLLITSYQSSFLAQFSKNQIASVVHEVGMLDKF